MKGDLMDEQTKILVAGMLTIAFYSNQSPLQSGITKANVPPKAPAGTLEEWQAQEYFRTMYKTFERRPISCQQKTHRQGFILPQ
jgi:hypothetical protein